MTFDPEAVHIKANSTGSPPWSSTTLVPNNEDAGGAFREVASDADDDDNTPQLTRSGRETKAPQRLEPETWPKLGQTKQMEAIASKRRRQAFNDR